MGQPTAVVTTGENKKCPLNAMLREQAVNKNVHPIHCNASETSHCLGRMFMSPPPPSPPPGHGFQTMPDDARRCRHQKTMVTDTMTSLPAGKRAGLLLSLPRGKADKYNNARDHLFRVSTIFPVIPSRARHRTWKRNSKSRVRHTIICGLFRNQTVRRYKVSSRGKL